MVDFSKLLNRTPEQKEEDQKAYAERQAEISQKKRQNYVETNNSKIKKTVSGVLIDVMPSTTPSLDRMLAIYIKDDHGKTIRARFTIPEIFGRNVMHAIENQLSGMKNIVLNGYSKPFTNNKGETHFTFTVISINDINIIEIYDEVGHDQD